MAAKNSGTAAVISTRDNAGTAQALATSGTSSVRGMLIQQNLLYQDMLNLVTFIRYSGRGDPGLVISTNFDIKNGNAISVAVAGVYKTLAANTNFDTGTTQVIAINKWSAGILTWDGTTARIRWSTTLNAASEALAIAALPAVTAGEAPIGYFTNLTGNGVTWTAGTDALQGGTGGTPATTTNYYNDPTVAGQYGVGSVLNASQIGNMSGTVITS